MSQSNGNRIMKIRAIVQADCPPVEGCDLIGSVVNEQTGEIECYYSCDGGEVLCTIESTS